MPQVRAAALTNYVEVARSVGLDPYRMLRRAGIDPGSLTDPEQRIAVAPVIQLLEASARESGCISFGLLMAESRTVASVGAVALLLKHERTAREVFDAIIEYQGLMGKALVLSIEQAGDTVIIRTDLVAGLVGRQAIELMMGIICRVVGAIASGRWRPECAHFLHDPPDELAVHQRIFQCPLDFRADFNGFTCSAESLDAPNPAAQSILAQHARRYLDMLAPETDDGSIVTRARRSLDLLLPAGRASLDQVAENLGLHPRALQRLLEKEGRTFAALLDEVRRELALRYLSDTARSVTSVAQMLGYASPSSFTRWFCAEFGVSPAAWRSGDRPDGIGSPPPSTAPAIDSPTANPEASS